MIYLVGQIFFCLALVAFVGLLVGWLLRGIGTHQREKELEATWRMRLRQRDTMLSKMANELAERGAGQKPAAVGQTATTRELETYRRALRDRDAQLAQIQGRVSKRDAQISQLLAEIRRTGGQSAVDKLLTDVNSGTFLDSGLHRVADLTPKTPVGSPPAPPPEAPRVAGNADEKSARIPPTTAAPAQGRTPPPAPAAKAAAPSLPAAEENDPSDRTHPEKISLQQEPLPDSSDPDELAFVYGISPALENKLMKLGITRYQQIAEFEAKDIERIAASLGIEPLQIIEENWVEGARQEHLAKYGELV